MSSDPDELISIYQGANVTEAHFVKNLLADQGIKAAVSGEHEPFALDITQPHVLVPRHNEAQARAIIDQYDDQQELRASRPDWTCAKCGATVIGAFDECDACGADRPGSEEEEDYSE